MVIDERKYNRRKRANIFHKLRTIAYDSNKNNVYGITIPRHIAEEFMNCNFTISLSGATIVLNSGCKHIKENEQEQTQNLLVK